MNKFTKTLVLSVAALSVVATSVEFASAGDRYWRKHHRGFWHRHPVVTGVAAGVVVGGVIAARPRVVYRQAPVVVDEGSVYDDDRTVYVDPDDDLGTVYRDEVPDDEDYAPRGQVYRDEDTTSRMERYADQGSDDDYFPDRPAQRSGKTQQSSRTKTSNDRQLADGGSLKPWSSEWRAYCADRYSSFNPSNGTYLGYDQKRHFCKAG